MKFELVLASGEVIPMDCGLSAETPYPIDRLDEGLSLLNENSLLLSKGLRCWRMVKGGAPVVEWNEIEDGDVLLGLTEPAPMANQSAVSSHRHTSTSDGGGYPIIPPSTKSRPVHQPDYAPPPLSKASSPTGKSPSFKEPLAAAGGGGGDTSSTAEGTAGAPPPPTAVLPTEPMPYVAACRLVVALSNKGVVESIVQVLTDAQKELLRIQEEREKLAQELAEQAADGGGATTSALTPEELEPLLYSLIPEEAIERLMEVGFSQQCIVRCLLNSNMNEEEALNRILSVEDPSIFEIPFSEEELFKYGEKYGLVESKGGRSGGKRNKPVDPRLLPLLDMGFEEEEAGKVLKQADGNADLAAAALLGESWALDRLRQSRRWYDKLYDEVLKEEASQVSVEGTMEILQTLRDHPDKIAEVWANPALRPSMAFLCDSFSNHLLPSRHPADHRDRQSQ